jgi:hypothetical protein
MQVQLLKLKLEELVVLLIKYQLKLVVLEQQIYLYVGLLDMLINELEEVWQLN